jgi:hypothetical protein
MVLPFSPLTYQVTPGAKDLTERYERFEIDAMKPAEKAYRKAVGQE